jgi:methionine-S-sulfoxide reductase
MTSMTSRHSILAAIAVIAIASVAAGGYFAAKASERARQRAQIKNDGPTKPPVAIEMSTASADPAKLETITLGSGCFWCTEAMFQNLRGVKSAVSGYSGGKAPNPSYEQVCAGNTGHAEVVQVTFDPSTISLDDILRVFWRTHDPTTLNRQGHDVGTQYRSAVFYHNEEQRKIAEAYKAQLDKSAAFGAPIVTEITPFDKFYPAEDYHQKYYDLNPNQGYCRMVISPKVEKFNKEFDDLLDKK